MPIRFIQRFIQNEAFTGGLLILMAVLAIVISNSPYAAWYHLVFESSTIWGISILKPVEYWVNHGLMSIFFLLVGLEIKRELLEGELNSVKKALLPGIAALGGMLIPAAIFMLMNYHQPAYWSAWSVPIATDIAFSLAVLQLFGSRVPLSLKLFLLALATFDDLGAVLIIAMFYTHTIDWLMLSLVLLILVILCGLNYFRIRFLAIYLVFGMLLWIFFAKSGIDAAIAGVFFAFTIPLRIEKSLLKRLFAKLYPWVNYMILPLFAFTNAGVSFSAMTVDNLFDALPMGIALALLVGKPLGVFSFSWAAVKLKLGHLPAGVSFSDVFGIGLLCGIGFTMSLLLGELAFKDPELLIASQIKAGILIGSVFAGILSYLWFSLRGQYGGK